MYKIVDYTYVAPIFLSLRNSGGNSYLTYLPALGSLEREISLAPWGFAISNSIPPVSMSRILNLVKSILYTLDVIGHR